jgi:hypothetical protein
MPQWVTREYLARRGGANFNASQVKPCRCPLLGWSPSAITVEGRPIGSWFFNVEKQPEVGPEAYDIGAGILHDFFKKELAQFLEPDLLPLGKRIIETCLRGGSIDEYAALIPHEFLQTEE